MTWGDKPTEAQINCIYRWLSWRMPNSEAADAAKWLQNNCNRKEVAKEMGRMKKLYDSHKLTRETAYESDVWSDYAGE
jgi:hypothetical protein